MKVHEDMGIMCSSPHSASARAWWLVEQICRAARGRGHLVGRNRFGVSAWSPGRSTDHR